MRPATRILTVALLSLGLLLPSPRAHSALVVPGAVSFVTGQAVPGPECDAALRHVVAFLADKPSITLLRVEVHTDEAGDAEQALTEARALAVVVRLQELGGSGVPHSLIHTRPSLQQSDRQKAQQNHQGKAHIDGPETKAQ